MGKSILIADDSAMMRNLLKDALSKSAYEVVGEAKNGVQVVEMYERLKPDVTLIDVTMPELDGMGALKQIIAGDPDAKCIMVSAMGQPSLIAEAIQCGAKDFINKPFNIDRILTAIHKALV
ncbi:MAG: response regulator [Firmicutes bacterium]|nr:response regulator [Bacillota bacterium]